jgi:hypothetical protein
MDCASGFHVTLGQLGPGKCVNCGFFAKKDTEPTGGDTYAVSVSERAARQVHPIMVHPTRNVSIGVEPFCFRRVIAVSEMSKKHGLAAVLDEDRKCPLWHGWHEGFSPKEHLEEERLAQLEEARRANDLKIAELDQRSQDATHAMMEEHTKISAEHAKTAEALRDISARNERQTSWFNGFFLIIGLAALILAIAAFAYPNGATWVVDHAPGAERDVTTPVPQSTPDTAGSPTE